MQCYLFTLWFTRILKQTKTRMLSSLYLPEFLGSGETSAVVVRSDGGLGR